MSKEFYESKKLENTRQPLIKKNRRRNNQNKFDVHFIQSKSLNSLIKQQNLK